MGDLGDYVNDFNHDLPYNIGSRGSCCFGGNIATNCGGSKMLLHGSMRQNILALEAVLADGTIVNTGQS